MMDSQRERESFTLSFSLELTFALGDENQLFQKSGHKFIR